MHRFIGFYSNEYHSLDPDALKGSGWRLPTVFMRSQRLCDDPVKQFRYINLATANSFQSYLYNIDITHWFPAPSSRSQDDAMVKFQALRTCVDTYGLDHRTQLYKFRVSINKKRISKIIILIHIILLLIINLLLTSII